MDMNPSFKAAVHQALGRPVIVAGRFHFTRYIYWAMDEVRRQVQKEWDKYNRTKCKRMRHVFYKRASKLSPKHQWYLQCYTEITVSTSQCPKVSRLRTSFGRFEIGVPMLKRPLVSRGFWRFPF